MVFAQTESFPISKYIIVQNKSECNYYLHRITAGFDVPPINYYTHNPIGTFHFNIQLQPPGLPALSWHRKHNVYSASDRANSPSDFGDIRLSWPDVEAIMHVVCERSRFLAQPNFIAIHSQICSEARYYGAAAASKWRQPFWKHYAVMSQVSETSVKKSKRWFHYYRMLTV